MSKTESYNSVNRRATKHTLALIDKILALILVTGSQTMRAKGFVTGAHPQWDSRQNKPQGTSEKVSLPTQELYDLNQLDSSLTGQHSPKPVHGKESEPQPQDQLHSSPARLTVPIGFADDSHTSKINGKVHGHIWSLV
jgi:hypothetical protein